MSTVHAVLVGALGAAFPKVSEAVPAAIAMASVPVPVMLETVTVRVVVPLPDTDTEPVAVPVVTKLTLPATKLTVSAPPYVTV